jgi:hypothetical protein
MPYNLTFTGNNTTIVEYLIEFNNVTTPRGLLSGMILLMIWVIIFLGLTSRNYDTKAAFTVSSYIAFVVSTLMLFAGLIGYNIVVALLALVVLTTFAVAWKN